MAALLVSDREREYTVGLLRGHWLSGRLTAEEFELRVAEAWRARFAADLWQALRWLPVDAPPVPPRTRSGTGPLVLAIAALSLLFVSLGVLFFVTLPMAVTAWALGRQARRSARSGARGRAAAAEALGIAGALLSLLPLAGLAALVSLIV